MSNKNSNNANSTKGSISLPDPGSGSITSYAYTEGTGERIASLMERKKLTWKSVSKLEGMPSLYQMQLWYKESADFRTLMDTADEMVARGAFDSIVESAEMYRDISKDEVPAEKLWFEKQKFIAEKADRKKFGQEKGQVSGGGVNIQIVMPVDYNKLEDISDIVDVKEITNIDVEAKDPDSPRTEVPKEPDL